MNENNLWQQVIKRFENMGTHQFALDSAFQQRFLQWL